MDDSTIIEDLIGTMTKYGYNCDRSNLSTCITVLLEDQKEIKNRVEKIHRLADLTNNFTG